MATPLTIIIPAKHEEQSIQTVLATIAKQVKTPHQIIVVSDTDQTDRTHEFVPKHVQLIHRINDKGTFASALQLGLDAVTTPAVVFVMADSCDDLKNIDRMYKKIMDEFDVVCASRYAKGGKKIGGPPLQSFFSWFVCTSLRVLTGIPTHDISNAFKMYKTSVIKKIPINPKSGVELSMDIVLQAYYNGANIAEIPTIWRDRTTDKSKFKLMERTPHYLRIYLWAVYNRLRWL